MCVLGVMSILQWLELVVSFTIALFLIVEPFGALPMFAVVTAKRTRTELARIAKRASITGAVVLVVFALVGRQLFAALGVSLDALRGAGGLVLMMTAIDMVRGKPARCRCTRDEAEGAGDGADVAIVPLGIPLLAGPGAMASVILLASDGGTFSLPRTAAVVLAILMTFAASYLVLRSAVLMHRLMGPAMISALERVLGLVLGALAVQLMATAAHAL